MSETFIPSELPPESTDDQPPTAAVIEQPFEDLTLAQAVGALRQAPLTTLRALHAVASAPREGDRLDVAAAVPAARVRSVRRSGARLRTVLDDNRRAALVFGLRLAAFLLAWWGAGILANTPQRSETGALVAGTPFLILGFLVWLSSELYLDWPQLRRRWQRQPAAEPVVEVVPESVAGTAVGQAAWAGFHPLRVLAALVGLFCSFLALRLNANNLFTPIGFWAWMASIVLWVAALAPAGSGPLNWARTVWQAIGRIHWRSGTVVALAAIMLLGAVFRLSALDSVPPEMTSDHVEKVLDAYGVLQGQHNVFFANNGGREPFQMYAMALLAQFPGLGFNHFTLKLLSAIEGLIAILLLYALGRAAVGVENPRLGTLVGLALAALVAASYWHTTLSRLGLRIVLTTAVTAALFIFLARALRRNRREDFILAGLILGFGLYTYQAVRMLPVVILIGVGLAFVFWARGLRERGRLLAHLAVLVVVAFVVFVPLFGYSLQYPEDFWRRTSGRLLGDDVITTTDESGRLIERQATLPERWQAFEDNLPILTNNIRNALLMFNWKGDVAWINGAPNQPVMDTFTGALLIVGLAAWLARIVRRRDVFDVLVPLALVIMLLPSALSIAYPIENPSHTRTSGALPSAYLIAALPLALLAQSLLDMLPGRRGQIAAVALISVVTLGAYSLNTRTYFEGHYKAYIEASYPYSEAGRVLRGFAESDGAYGNAFMIAYPYWWDHRALGIEAGQPEWPNGIVSVDQLKDVLFAAYQKMDTFRLDPNKDLLFFLSADATETLDRLRLYFPDGRVQVRQSYQHDDAYMLYRVPALGEEAFLTWLAGSP
jgi:hypothetical protein